jgi:NTE family protein
MGVGRWVRRLWGVSDTTDQARVAVVLSGGGARGAYEAGALSVLLPVLEQRGERPRILVGTSAGAVNVSFLASHAQLGVGELIGEAVASWTTMSWGQVVRPLVSIASLRRLGGYAGEVLGVAGAQVESLLDPAPLRRTLRQQIDFDQLTSNIEAGRVQSAAVVATSALTGRSVVFHAGRPSPPADNRRGIDYVATALAEEHVLASAAIPVVFPAVHVERPPAARGWYFDGGTRLNTPIKPALKLGAERVVVIAVSPLASGPAALAGERRPDALVAAGQILIGILGNQLIADVHTLAMVNALIGKRRQSASVGKRRVPYIVIAPAEPDPIAVRALAVVREHYSSAVQIVGSPDVALLARLTAAGDDVAHATLLSFLLFTPEFAQALIELGRQDATRWLEQAHDLDDLWQIGPLTPSV